MNSDATVVFNKVSVRSLSSLLCCYFLFATGAWNAHAFDGIAGQSSIEFNKSQRVMADQLISIFENNTPQLQYAYARRLHDGRGVTAGRAGFTSATGDLLQVVKRYSQRVPGNVLEPFIPRLTRVAKNWSGSTWRLGGLSDAWREASDDPEFRKVQDEVVDDMYYQRALVYAKKIGADQPLTLLFLYDAIIQHGFGSDPDGLPELIRCTTQKLDGAPKDGIDEAVWSQQFLELRREVLRSARNSATRAVWAESVARVNTLMQLLEAGNNQLDQTIVINPWGTEFILTPMLIVRQP